jgi:hypothetical protein
MRMMWRPAASAPMAESVVFAIDRAIPGAWRGRIFMCAHDGAM